MSDAEDPVSESLGEVRKSFRVLHEYNKFVTDLISYLAENIPDFEFYQWRPSYTAPPPNRGSTPLNRNPWRYLPLYDFSVLLLPDKDSPLAYEGDTMVEINLSTESAFLEAADNRGLPEGDPVEESVSTIGIYLWLSNTDQGRNWFKGIWHTCPYYPDDMAIYQHPHAEVTITGPHDNLENVADREGADRLLGRFREAVQTNLGNVLPS